MRIDTGRSFGRRECPACACDVAANNNRCPICGYEFPNRTAGFRTFRWFAAVIMLVLLLSLILAGVWR